MNAIRKWLLTGLLVLVPVLITVLVLRWFVMTMDGFLVVLPAAWHPDELLGMHIPGLGLIVVLLLVLVVGALASNYFGRQLIDWSNGFLERIPVVRNIYSSVRQVSDTLFSGSGNAFRQAVLVQWPAAGSWTIAFQTGRPDEKTAAQLTRLGQHDCVCLFVPTAPNPTSGYFIIVPQAAVHPLEMSVDAALKYVISMGVVAPANTVIPVNPYDPHP